MRKSFIIVCAIFACAFGQSVKATETWPQVAFTTLDDTGNYWQNAGIRISGASAFPDGYEAYANQFVPLKSGTLSSIELGLGYSSWAGPDSQVDVRLSLATGGLPLSNPVLASGTLTTATPFGAGGLTSFIPSTLVQLDIGQAYWLIVTPHSDTTASTWCNPNHNIVGTFGYTSPFNPDPLAWNTGTGAGLKAFRVNVVPEPSMFALVGLGATVGLMLRKRAGA